MSYGPYESECYSTACGGKVCLTPAQHRDAWESGATFYCSQGHAQHFTKPRTRTYSEMEVEVDRLRKQLANAQRTAEHAWEYAEEVRQDWATCPFPDCPRAPYHYANQRTLLNHLDRWHGTDVAARVSWAMVEEVDA